MFEISELYYNSQYIYYFFLLSKTVCMRRQKLLDVTLYIANKMYKLYNYLINDNSKLTFLKCNK